ncbi:MAG: hypothetical protein KTR15_05275 [Phycisphaeraceae bacterium]|nr:hypothetical protein [Phycisphaeraceae bacterium]
MQVSRDQLRSILTKLPQGERGGSVLDVLGWLDMLDDAGYSVELFVTDDHRVYRAVDPETGERMQVHTVPEAVTYWVAARGVAGLWGLVT